MVLQEFYDNVCKLTIINQSIHSDEDEWGFVYPSIIRKKVHRDS